jgi:hypothetical protein
VAPPRNAEASARIERAKSCAQPDAPAKATAFAPVSKRAPRVSTPERIVASALCSVPARDEDPTIITPKPWKRILEGELFATSPRLEWAVLLKRSHGLDALRCPRCDGAMRPIATLTDAALLRTILTRLGLRAQPLPRAPARDPTGQASFDFAVA